jgi:hypothetical protein
MFDIENNTIAAVEKLESELSEGYQYCGEMVEMFTLFIFIQAILKDKLCKFFILPLLLEQSSCPS